MGMFSCNAQGGRTPSKCESPSASRPQAPCLRIQASARPHNSPSCRQPQECGEGILGTRHMEHMEMVLGKDGTLDDTGDVQRPPAPTGRSFCSAPTGRRSCKASFHHCSQACQQLHLLPLRLPLLRQQPQLRPDLQWQEQQEVEGWQGLGRMVGMGDSPEPPEGSRSPVASYPSSCRPAKPRLPWGRFCGSDRRHRSTRRYGSYRRPRQEQHPHHRRHPQHRRQQAQQTFSSCVRPWGGTAS
mmetsp:Transcript_18863/g.29508  ORF Transcript_18863/g.29508 Transcript_18863/m.29508 type:complete len:242 (+) Transcript_18863:333-1058(+)